MAYNNGFPMNYPYQYVPQAYPPPPQMQNQQAQQSAQALTPPTIHADIIQLATIKDAEAYPLSAGLSQMFMTRDESAIVIKEAFQNGNRVIVYDRRPEAPPAPVLDPSQVVTWDELEAYLANRARRTAEPPADQPAQTTKRSTARSEKNGAV